MASKKFLGRAQAVAQVDTVQITAYDAATTYILTVGGETVSTPGVTDADGTASALADAWNNSTHPYFTGVTASVSTDTVTLTADTAGVPFTSTSSKSGGTGTIGSVTSSTASAGPNDLSTAANFSDGAALGNNDTLVLADSSVDILWGLDQSSVTGVTLIVEKSFTGRLGLPVDKFTTGANGAEDSSVDEYRDTYLQLPVAEARIGENFGTGNPTGCRRLKLDCGSAASAIEVYSVGVSFDSDPPMKLKINNSSATVKVYDDGKLEIENEDPADAGQVSYIETYGDQSFVVAGSGLVMATVEVKAGRALLHEVPTSLIVEEGAEAILTATSSTTCTIEKRGEITLAGCNLTDINLVG